MSSKIVPHKSLISLRIQTFFFDLPTVNSENPSGMGLFHPFLRAIPTLGNIPTMCMTWAIIQLSSIWKQLGASMNPKDSMSLSDILGCMKLNSLDIICLSLDYVLCYHTEHVLSRKIVPCKSLILLNKLFFFDFFVKGKEERTISGS